jgi:acetolactate synthase-1/2/3 large subunit
VLFRSDVTISNSTFGNRYVSLAAPHLGVHALGGGIGQGVPMAIGGAIAGGEVKAVALVGDGGTQLCLGELTTLADEDCNLVVVMMNDRAYGVISNIQDAQFEGRRAYCRLRTPDFGLLARSIGLAHVKVDRIEDFAPAFDRALATPGAVMLEVDMTTIGPFARPFGGPPAGAAGGAR